MSFIIKIFEKELIIQQITKINNLWILY